MGAFSARERIKTETDMDRLHPLGDDLAPWVDLSDDYGTRLAHAAAAEIPKLGGRAVMARHIREIARMVRCRDQAGAQIH